MAWKEVLPEAVAARAATPCIRISLSKAGKSFRMSVLVHGLILAKIGGPRKQYSVFLGSGEDAHLLRIVEDKTGEFKPTRVGWSKGVEVYRFRLPFVEKFPQSKQPAVPCRYELPKSNEATINMPSWAWKTPPSRRP